MVTGKVSGLVNVIVGAVAPIQTVVLPLMVAVGVGLTVIATVALTPAQGLLVVNVKVALPEYPEGGPQVALSVVLFGLNVPPIPPSVQVPPVE